MRPYDERLDHFLSRAAKVFADQGYHSTTMRDLAAATDMSLAGMYYYVRGKEELLFRIQERCFMRVLAGAESALTRRRAGRAGRTTIGHQRGRWFLGRGCGGSAAGSVMCFARFVLM